MSEGNNIKVSVILPSLNVADYIEQCVRSVAGQTISELEILCIDAGSTDGTWDKLEKLAASNPKIRLLRSDVKSYGYQMNLGIKEARGEYIGIVETDDWVDSDMFEVLYQRAAECKADMAKGVLYEVYAADNGEEKEIIWDYISEKHADDAVFSPDDEPEVHDWDGNIWNGIYRREFLVDKNIWFQETPGAAFQDIAFQQMVLNEADTVIYMHSHFYHYRRVRPGASTWNPKCVRYIYRAYEGLLADERLKDSHRKYIYKRMAPAFLNELRKCLCLAGYDFDVIECPEAVDWYEAEVRNAIHRGIFRLEDLSEYNKDDVMLFFADRGSYARRLKEQMESMYAWLDELKARQGDRRLVIFGMGQYGLMLVHFLIKNGIWIDGLADNQKWLNNTSYYGLCVRSADDEVRENKDGFFLIANRKSGLQISHQLKNRGVSEDRIWIFDGVDKMLLAGIRKNLILAKREM